MRDSTIRVTTKVKNEETGETKKYGAKKVIQVPSTLQECLDKFGDSGVVEFVVSGIEAEETQKLRQKLSAKVSGGGEATAADVEEVSIED